MAHYYPVVFPAGRSLAGDSLGFHAYSLRVDNCTNQWYLEESTVSYIPPYSLGMCLRLYGTGVAILLAQAPIGQPQLAPITGEQVVGVYSDQLRTEVAASPIRQFTLVQSVSDLTQGPQPALPPVGVDRLYADASGNIHHLHSNGTDLTLVDPSNAGTLLFPTFDPHYQALMNNTPLGADLFGTVGNGHVQIRYGSLLWFYDQGGTLQVGMGVSGNDMHLYPVGGGSFIWNNQAGTVNQMVLDAAGNLTVRGTGTFQSTLQTWANLIAYDITLTGVPSGYGIGGSSGPIRVTLTSSSMNLASDVALTGGLNIMPGLYAALSSAGTWLVTCTLTMLSGAAANGLILYLYNGNTGQYYGGTLVSNSIASGGYGQLSISDIITVSAANNINAVAAVFALPATIKAHESVSNPGGNTGISFMRAVRLS